MTLTVQFDIMTVQLLSWKLLNLELYIHFLRSQGKVKLILYRYAGNAWSIALSFLVNMHLHRCTIVIFKYASKEIEKIKS